MRMMSTVAVLAISMLGLAAPANAEMFGGKLNVKAGVAGVLPDESATTTIGGTADISDEYVPALMFEYDLSERVSVELFCCLAPHEVKAVETDLGDVDLGEVTLFPPVVTAKYRLLTSGPVRPYVGAGVNVTVFFNEDVPDGVVNSIDYETTIGPALQLGADFPINDRLSLNIDVKKVWIEPEVAIATDLGDVEADAEINPIIGFVGIGYRF